MLENERFISGYLETLSAEQRIFLSDLRNFRIGKYIWDLDGTIGDTDEIVKPEFDKALGTSYRLRTDFMFDGLSLWASQDGIMSFEEANAIEGKLWTDEGLLAKVGAFPGIQRYSKEAVKAGATQYIVTSRKGTLRNVTFQWSEANYPWIPPENIRITQNLDVRYDAEFKVAEVHLIEPDVVIDDNLDHVLRMLRVVSAKTRFVWFAKSFDFAEVSDERILAIPGGALLFSTFMSHNLDTLALK